MTAKVHLEGMGVTGSMLAAKLADEGIEFTWNDTDTKVNGWKAGTGCVLPTGHDVDQEGHERWLQSIGEPETEFDRWMSRFMDLNRWVYISKNPPHKGKRAGIEAVEEVGPLKFSNSQTINLDTQKMVVQTRTRFSEAEQEPSKKQLVIVTHGTANAVRFTWGWSGIVKVAEHPKVREALDGERATYYLRKGILIAYFYPRPHTDTYYAGTDIISQHEPKSLEIEPKYETWKRQVEERTDGLVKVAALKPGSLREGWRPMPAEDAPFAWREDGRIHCKPMSGDGVRHFPVLAEAVLEELG